MNYSVIALILIAATLWIPSASGDIAKRYAYRLGPKTPRAGPKETLRNDASCKFC